MDKFIKWVGVVVVAIIALLALSLLFSIPVWLLWNWLMPMIFGLMKITIWQAWGLLALSSFLFKCDADFKTKQR